MKKLKSANVLRIYYYHYRYNYYNKPNPVENERKIKAETD